MPESHSVPIIAAAKDLSSIGNLRENPFRIDSALIKNSQKKRLAYVITITKDGYFGLDGAAVLAFSIINSTSDAARSIYDISFIALVHPNVTTTRPGLERLGPFIVLWKDII